ncbi:non-homologous end-joining DNA ligase [Micromonospora endophytica]|uniref:ATP-dependent DNA ligase n=1 Tax=Micromonospora endophytica TaxID=515350 RepID=A0A2W2BMD3_9ACTN|nr:non-homologous end-joining DNA ligase [Micromonospora endophytica]PZF87202.1 ATP-dependent DNA ligase [Micromonospora endophytica]RIW40505.1 ATP-dependent DNA ligase [Micromonospora endophytica]BCJ58935.1 ATP-dependent DNA ligase [Micromonospora endophytica]
MPADRLPVEVEGRRLELSNLDKVLYPQAGFTKGEVIDYYTRIAPVLLPHLKDRALTRIRYPNGVEGNSFFEKNAPAATPDWVRTENLPAPGSSKGRETIDYVVADDLPTLVWLANLAALELHTPQWKVGAHPDLMVVDLDPGAPASLEQCCQVALLLRDRLADDGVDAYPKTSGKKGMQLCCPISGTQSADDVSAYARRIAQDLEREHPKLIVSRMAKNLRPGKIFIDWSQNNAAKTTVAPYSLRAEAVPSVSTPLTWDEVAAGPRGKQPGVRPFTAAEVLQRAEECGDLLGPLLHAGPELPAG